MIHAPGGMGKSALIARFALQHLEPTGEYPALPFVFLDFDRTVLIPERFPTLPKRRGNSRLSLPSTGLGRSPGKGPGQLRLARTWATNA